MNEMGMCADGRVAYSSWFSPTIQVLGNEGQDARLCLYLLDVPNSPIFTILRGSILF